MATLLSDKLKGKNVILASKSPRRQELLKSIIPEFTIEIIDVEELFSPDLKREEIALFLAKLKARSYIPKLKTHDVLITSDTIVCIGEEVLNKPVDRPEAKKMLQTLSGKMHTVITGVCLSSCDKNRSFYDVTDVFFDELSDEEIDFYLDNFEPYDKAGSYGIQEWIGYIGIEKIEGSYFNVMGLPTRKLYRELNEFLKDIDEL